MAFDSTEAFQIRRFDTGVNSDGLARGGISTVLIPQRNEPDLDDVPAEVLQKLDVHPVGDVREVLRLALEPVQAAVAEAAWGSSGQLPPPSDASSGVAGPLGGTASRTSVVSDGVVSAGGPGSAAGKTSVAARSQIKLGSAGATGTGSSAGSGSAGDVVA